MYLINDRYQPQPNPDKAPLEEELISKFRNHTSRVDNMRRNKNNLFERRGESLLEVV
jgi:hypothetical protein